MLSQPVKYRFVHDPAFLEVLAHDPLEERGIHVRVPDPLRIYHDDRTIGAHAEAGRLTALHPLRAEEKPFALEQAGEPGIQIQAAPLG